MRLVAVVMVTLLGASVQASAQRPQYTVVGFGGDSCGTWIEARGKGRSTAMQYWALGFVSGANTFRIEGNDFVKDTDANAIWVWLDNFCRSRPLELFGSAVDQLAVDLKARAH